MAYNIHYASGANAEDTGLPPQLMAGDTPPVSTQDFAFSLATAIGQFVPLTRDGDSFEPWAAGDSVDAISAYDIPVGDSRAAVYTEGMFNIDALAWPEGTTEVEGFLAADDARLAALPWARHTILGAYAAPVAGDAT